MNKVMKLINRFAIVLLLSSFIIVIINAVLFIVLFSKYAVDSPWATAKEIAIALKETESGYSLDTQRATKLQENNVFAFFIDNNTMKVVWNTDNLPTSIALLYNASSISSLTRGYLEEYSTFVAETENGLMVLGYPEKSYFTLKNPSWDYDFIANLPVTILLFFAVNIVVIFLIYMTLNDHVIKSFQPIIEGITLLPTGNTVCLKENGVLSNIAKSINDTFEVIQTQNSQLRKKETARANWIAGISHDIRTPLSMIMGYASCISENETIDNSVREQAKIIQKQSVKIKELIDDINLASRIEYDMQPLDKRKIRLSKLLRNYVAHFLNTSTYNNYNIDIEISQDAEQKFLECDERLIIRAINNLVLNSIEHNPKGCDITLMLHAKEQNIILTVCDTGIGFSQKKIQELNENTHYMESTDDKLNLRHGMGFLIVKQIVHAHNGKIDIYNSNCVRLIFNLFV